MGWVPRLQDVLRLQAWLGLLLWLGALAIAPAQAQEAAAVATVQPPGDVTVMNRRVATLRGTLFGITAQARALEARRRIGDALNSGAPLEVSTQDRAEGTMVQLDGAMMFAIIPGDTLDGTLPAARTEAQRAAALLQQAIEESRESRNLKSLLTALGVTLLATLVAAALLWGAHRLKRKVEGWIVGQTLAHADRLRVGGVDVVKREGLVHVEQLLVNAVFWLVVLLLGYEWLGITLAQFPFTRVWGEQLNGFLFGLLGRFALSIVRAVPDLVAAGLIFWLAFLLTKTLRGFFAKVATGQVRLSWLGADVALTTSRLCVAAVWLFALAMAYPYLPGSDTEAFKGLSVLVGLMISLGASNLVGQLASGLILTYTRTFHKGEYVRFGDDEGTVMSLGTFTTRIRTGMGEELTISNTQILGAVTRNYSRAVKGHGFIVDTTVTIGYDAPWRQVTAMLIEAARRTPGVLAEPPPRVFQTALSDFYPEYRLVCQAVPSEPRPRAEVMSLLHANVQDVFNEHGVQIMSPHYLGDPATEKIVPRAKWYAPPAKPPEDPG
ncbi:MAG: mechanosensitive ion channel family protein [Burkholderiaceae bacterium]|nr:mechanosensitive ion channel family protein [Burkholderiaceae bacterium]